MAWSIPSWMVWESHPLKQKWKNHLNIYIYNILYLKLKKLKKSTKNKPSESKWPAGMRFCSFSLRWCCFCACFMRITVASKFRTCGEAARRCGVEAISWGWKVHSCLGNHADMAMVVVGGGRWWYIILLRYPRKKEEKGKTPQKLLDFCKPLQWNCKWKRQSWGTYEPYFAATLWDPPSSSEPPLQPMVGKAAQ